VGKSVSPSFWASGISSSATTKIIAPAANANANGKTGLAIGNALIALSAVSSAAFVSADLLGAAVFGLGAGPLGLVAVGLFVIGAGIVWACTDDPLEVWAKKSMWGKKYDGSSVESQIRKLHEVLCEFGLYCNLYAEPRTQHMTENGYYWDYNYYFMVRIKPGMLNDGNSKYIVNVSVVENETKSLVLTKRLILPDSRTEIRRDGKDGPVKLFLRSFNVEDYGLGLQVQYMHFKYEISGQLDLDGDGKQVFPQLPMKKDGKLELIGMDEQF